MKNLILLLISLLFMSCRMKGANENELKNASAIVSLDGLLSDVSPNENSFIYEFPKDIDSEFSDAKLIYHQLSPKVDIEISDSVKYVDNLQSKFFNDTIIIVPTEKNILLYNLKERKFFEKLTNLKVGEYLIAFNISSNRKKLAFIVLNAPESKFITHYLDLSTKALTKVEHSIDANDDDGEYFCSINIIENRVVFNLNNNLYVLNSDTNIDNLISSHLSFNAYGKYLYAIDTNQVIFVEGYDELTKYNAFDFKTDKLKQLDLNLNISKNYQSNVVIFSSYLYKDDLVIQLFSDFSYKYVSNTFLKQQDFMSYEGYKIFIRSKRGADKDSFVVYKFD